MARAINKQRCRTIAKLLTAGIRHRLYLYPTQTLFDRPELLVWNATPEQKVFIEQYFAEGRPYVVKVSGMGSSQTIVSPQRITFKKSTHKQLMLEFGDDSVSK